MINEIDLSPIRGTFVHDLLHHLLESKLTKEGFTFRVNLDEIVVYARELKRRSGGPPNADGDIFDVRRSASIRCQTAR